MPKVKETPQEVEARKKKEFEAALAKLQRAPNDVALVRHIQGEGSDPVVSPAPVNLPALEVGSSPEVSSSSGDPPSSVGPALSSVPGTREVLPLGCVEAGVVAAPVEHSVPEEPAGAVTHPAEEPERPRKWPTATVASPTAQVVFDQLEPQVRDFKIPARAKKRSVAVCEDVFSRVSHFSFASDGLDKGLILSFLLDRYIPKEIGQGMSVARWLMREPETEDKIRYLPFYEDMKLKRRLAGLKEFHGLSKVTLIENVVLQALPPSPHNIPPTRRRRV